MRASDLEDVLRRAPIARQTAGIAPSPAARSPGKPLGGFRYHGTRPDDPNDVVPHEHRRELRALKVFGAWTNLVDMKAGNTLDTLIHRERPRRSSGTICRTSDRRSAPARSAPREWDEGYEYLYEGDTVWKRFSRSVSTLSPWQTVPYEEHRAIGRFEGDAFDPEAVEAARAGRGGAARARRRQVLGGAAGDGVLRRDDPRDRARPGSTRSAPPSGTSPTC